MESFLFQGQEVSSDDLRVEGWHKPGSLTRASGVWIHAAGKSVLEPGDYPIRANEQWVWFAVAEGETVLDWEESRLELSASHTCIFPSGQYQAVLHVQTTATCLWMAFEGPLAPMVIRKLGALLHMPLRQTALPSQMSLADEVCRVCCRHSGTSNATYQLQQLMYGMIASHWGQPVSVDAQLSHEIAKVVDALRSTDYRENYSLTEMAEISRMPLETFRKRFVSEVGMPPLSYVLHCKMERAKELLREHNCSVRETGIRVGMQDPYHFSKQFKNIVGVSPSTFMKQAANPDATIRKDIRKKK